MKMRLAKLIELLENGTFILETLQDACALIYYLDLNYGRRANIMYDRIIACDKGGHFAIVWSLYINNKLSTIQKEALLYHYRYTKLGRELRTCRPMKPQIKPITKSTLKRISKETHKGLAKDLHKPSQLVSIINGNVTVVKNRYYNSNAYFEEK